jgi:formamidopyrimidine-DNA glycosylase
MHFLTLDDGRELRYTDIRRFGRIRILLDGEREAVLGHLGLDPLEAGEKEFREAIAKRGARIKALLMDQSVFRGMGNIYTDGCIIREWHAGLWTLARLLLPIPFCAQKAMPNSAE